MAAVKTNIKNDFKKVNYFPLNMDMYFLINFNINLTNEVVIKYQCSKLKACPL